MAGYIGSKAVNLSTTGADINGDANIDGDLSFRDNDKIKLGAGSDLQIYHDSATGHSIITESGGGALQLRGENLILEHPTTGNNYLLGVDGASGYVKLYHNGVDKLATTSTGIDVTGTVTADGLTGDSLLPLSITAASGRAMNFYANGGTLAAKVASTGDISFYEDTGTTPKLFWDASAESLGIGTSSPAYPLVVKAPNPRLQLLGTGTNTGTSGLLFGDADTATRGQINYTHSSDSLNIVVNAQEAMRITSSGLVGIGTSLPNGLLELSAGDGGGTLNIVSTVNAANSGNKIAFFAAGRSDTDEEMAYIKPLLVTNSGGSGNVQEGHLTFGTFGSERMRIDSSGNVGIGTSSPSELLEVSSTGASAAIEVSAGEASTTTGEAKIVLRSLHSSSGTTYSRSEIASLGVAGGDSDLIFRTTTQSSGPEEHMRIDSEGNVGIGTSSPSSQDTSANNLVIDDTAGNGGLTIKTPATSIGAIHFSDGTSGADRYRGIISYSHSENSMRFHTDTARAMTIDADGRVTTPNQPRFLYHASGDIGFTAAQSSWANLAVFNQEHHNIGNHYNTTTDTFTCPVAGVYAFFVNVREETYYGSWGDIQVAIAINGTRQAVTRKYDGSQSEETLKIYTTRNCAANDTVNVQVNSSSSDTNLSVEGSRHTWFGGHLLG